MGFFFFFDPKADEILADLIVTINNSSYKEIPAAEDCLLYIKTIYNYGTTDEYLSVTTINIFKEIKAELEICLDEENATYLFNKLLVTLYPLLPLNKTTKKKGISYNSEVYYENEIKDIEKERESLLSQISELKNKQSETEAETQEHKRALKQKEEELSLYVSLTKQYEAEKKEQNKINDAISVWNNKIKAAFDTLKTYIRPIKREHTRLCLLYWFYLGLSVILITCIAVIEYKICNKIIDFNGLPTWEIYFSVILPIPISLALLWGFIHEMNRAQRQLVIIAKQIHEIEYVEGLLLTTNMLSTDINESMNRVNLAINKLLENHLNYKDDKLNDETLLKGEEHKDLAPHEVTLKILKQVNELIASRK